MIEIGDSLQELRIKHSGKIYLLWGNKWIDVLDNNGNLNIRIKNLINRGTPSSSSSNGFYYNGDNIYLKLDSDIINMSSLSSSSLPEGSVIMYEGDSPPEGWYLYDVPTGINGVIYIVNILGTEPYSGGVELFSTILDKFNRLNLYSPSIERTGSTLYIYNYLENMYNSAEQEYKSNYSNLFKSSTYLEIYNYRGNNNQYEIDGTAQNAMLYWLMAMCLSELVYTKGNNNNQTQLFKFAYDIGKETGYGRKIRLYNNYTLKGDPYICRLVASAIYSKNRQTYANSILNFRNIFGTETIYNVTVSDPTDLWMENLRILRNSPTQGNAVSSLGYGINIDEIFPSPAGPYLSLYNNRVHPSLLLDLSDIDDFNFDSNSDYYQNYDIDVLIYEKVVANYSIKSNLNLSRCVLAVADDELLDSKWLLANKIYYTYNSANPLDSFTLVPISNNYFRGTFNEDIIGRDLSGYMNDPRVTNLLYLVRNAGEKNRYTTLDPLYGRRRPCLGNTDPSSKQFGNSYMYDVSIEKMFGNSVMYDLNALVYYIDRNKNNVYDGSVVDGSEYLVPVYATTYPSGHSAGIWAIAMIMMELFPNKYDKIYKAAYDFTISRLIVRAHWNSDIMYGKLSATTIVPILHAMLNFNTTFLSTITALEGTPEDPLSNFYIKITNNTSDDAYITEEFMFFDYLSCYISTQEFTSEGEGHYYVIPSGESITYRPSQLDMVLWTDHTGNSFVNLDWGTPVRIYGYCPTCNSKHNSLIYLGTITNGQTSFGNYGYDISLTEGSNYANRYLIDSTKVVIDNATGSDAYITGEIYFFVDNSNHDGFFMTYTSDAIQNGEGGYYGVTRIPPGKTSFDIQLIETYGSGVTYGQNLRLNENIKNGITTIEDKVRVYGVSSDNTAKHELTIFSCSVDKTTFNLNTVYNITLRAGRNYNLMWTGSNVSDLGLGTNLVNISNTGGETSISVTSTSLFTASSNLSWCTINISGNSLILNVSSNDSFEDRTAIITVSNNSTTKLISVIQAADPGNSILLYKVGLISDVHYQVPDSLGKLTFSGTATSSDNNSFYREDLSYIINYFKLLNVEFIASPGDIATNSLNELIEFTRDYIKSYTGIDTYTGTSFLSNSNYKKFYCALGNHDHHVVYSDTSKCKYVNYNSGVNTHNGLRWRSVTYNGTLYNCPAILAGNVTYFSSNSKSYTINSNNGDIYIFLSAFYGDPRAASDDGAGHDMSQMHPHNLVTSALILTLKQYILQEYNNTYVFPENESNFNFLYYKYEDLIELKDIITNSSNRTKRIFVFSHYFLPNKSGGNNEYPGEGYNGGASTCLMGITFHLLNCLNNKYKNVIWFSGHSHLSWNYGNAKRGLHWTNKNYKYIIPTSSDNSSILNNYTQDFYATNTGNAPYNRLYAEVDSSEPVCGWNVHLPSLSRPIDSSGKNLPACEAAIMEIYSNKIEIKKLGFERLLNGNYVSYTDQISDKKLTTYGNNGTGTCNDVAPEIGQTSTEVPEPNNSLIAFKITNNSNATAIFTGELSFYYYDNGQSGNRSEGYFCFRNRVKYTNGETTYSYKDSNDVKHYYLSNGDTYAITMHENTDKLEPGESMTLIFSKMVESSSSSIEVGGSGHNYNLSTIVGKYFSNNDSNVASFPNNGVNYDVKLRVQIYRDWPTNTCENGTWPSGKTRADVSPNTMLYAKITDSNKQILLGRTYNVSITQVRDSYSNNTYVRREYVGLSSNSIANLNLVQVYYNSSQTTSSSLETPENPENPVSNDYVEINGVKWATSNAGSNKTFTEAQALADAAGSNWRLPTKAEFDSLINAYREKSSTEAVFGSSLVYVTLPAEGYNDGNSGQARYWTSTDYDSTRKVALLFSAYISCSTQAYLSSTTAKASVRLVYIGN